MVGRTTPMSEDRAEEGTEWGRDAGEGEEGMLDSFPISSPSSQRAQKRTKKAKFTRVRAILSPRSSNTK